MNHLEGGQGRPNHEEPTPAQAGRPENNQPTLEVGEGRGGVPPPQGEQAKPQQEGRERKRRSPIVYNPKKETREEYRIRYDQEHARRKLEDESPEQIEKRRKYQREYMRGYRKSLKERRQAGSAQQEQEQPAETMQIFPSPRET